jgi:DNA-binding NtrC family response regulator
VAINCGAIPRQLAESELFGHEPGAFTGAHRQHIGAFERAGGGTLFLDELTEMPLDLQVVLLRVLENRTFQRVGGTREQPAEVRVIAGSNRDPYAAVRDGRLRQDLFFRLRVMPIEVPPLRARSGDILMLAEHFLAEYQAGREAPKAFSPFAREAVLSHTWPGNVRELRNAVSRAVVLASGSLIEPENLDLDSPDTAPRESTRPAPSRPVERPHLPNAPRRSAGAPGSSPGDVAIPPHYTLAQAERLIIESTLVRFGFNRGLTARALGISDKTLYNKCRAWQLVSPPRPRSGDDKPQS